MSKLDDAIRQLARRRKKLAPLQGRRARRSARLKLLASLRAVKAAMDEEFPKVAKAVRTAASDPGAVTERPIKLRLPFDRAHDIPSMKLFCRIMSAIKRVPVPKLEAHGGAIEGKSADDFYKGRIIFRSDWSSRAVWNEVVGYYGWTKANVDLWRMFWSEPIEVPDLGLAAEHSAFLEKALKRSTAANKAIETRTQNEMRGAAPRGVGVEA